MDGVFSLELSHQGSGSLVKSKSGRLEDCSDGASRVDVRKVAAYCAPATPFEYRLLEAVKSFKPECSGPEGFSHVKLAARLSAAGYTVSVQTSDSHNSCNCKTKTRRCLETLSHAFLSCTGFAATFTEVDLIIEPQFKEQFEIAHPTPAFKSLLRALPLECVGSRVKLKTMVEVVSACVAEAFQSQDLPLPPWRRKGAVLSKWNLGDHSADGRSPGTSPERQPVMFSFPEPQDRRPAHTGCQNPLPGRSSFSEQTFTKLPVPPVRRHISGTERGSHNSFGSVRRDPDGRMPVRLKGKETRTVSLLARGLADMRVVRGGKRPLDVGCTTESLKRAPSWDLSLPHIHTVRRAGRAS